MDTTLSRRLQTTIIQSFFADQSRWFLWWPVGIGTGIAFYFSLTHEPSFIYAFLPLITSLIGILSVRYFWQDSSARFFLLMIPLCMCFSIFLGFAAAQIRTASIATPFLTMKIDNIHLTGRLEDIEEQPNRRRLTLTDLICTNKDVTNLSKIRLTFPLSQDFPAAIGDRISFLATLLPLGAPTSLAGYNFRRQAYFQGISAIGHIKSPIQVIKHQEKRLWLTTQRYHLTQAIRQHLSDQEAEIAAALITGDRSGILPSIRQEFTDAGLAHILAISGLHLTIVAGITFFLFRRSLALIPYLAENYPIKKWAALWVIVATFAYLAISGFGIPGQRAFVMITIMMIAILFDRNPLSMRLVAVTGSFILLIRPESLLSASFQLSFAAVIGLIAAYEDGWRHLKQWRLEGKYCWQLVAYGIGILATTLIATLATTPYIIAIFNRFTLQTLAGNFLAIPLMTLFLMPVATFSVLSLMWGGNLLCFQLFSFSLKCLLQIARTVATWPGAAIIVSTPPPIFIGLITLGGLWICFWKSPWRWAGLILCAFGYSSVFFNFPATIYAAANGIVLAYQKDNVLFVSDLNRGNFFTDQWMKELGLKEKKPWPTQQIKVGPVLLLKRQNMPLKISKEMCSAKTFITNGYALQACQKWGHIPLLLIDQAILKRDGTYQIWLTKDGVDAKSVLKALGKRPWSLP